MTRQYSLAQLTALELDPPAMVMAAAKAGYEACGIRLLPVAPGATAYRLQDNPALLADTQARMRDTGVRVADLEIIRLNEGFDVRDYLAFFEVGQKLGAQNILVAGDDPDEARVTDAFGRLCDACAPYGLTADIEFMPWLPVDRISTAQRIVEAAGRDNGGVLVDALHFARSPSRLDELAALPAGRVHYAQICDAPAETPADVEGLLYTAREARFAPGDGGIALADIFDRLPADTLISVEIPNAEQSARMGTQAWVEYCLARSKALLEGGRQA